MCASLVTLSGTRTIRSNFFPLKQRVEKIAEIGGDKEQKRLKVRRRAAGFRLCHRTVSWFFRPIFPDFP